MTAVTAETATWTLIQKIAFRFFMLLFLLYIFFNPNGVLPYSDNLYDFYIKPFHNLIPWLAQHVLHMANPVTIFTNGSGDTTYDYLIILFITILSAIGAAVWSVADRSTPNYNKLLYWLTVVIRYYVGITMVAYGSFKIIKLQFPFPSFAKLTEPLGNMSPMGLAWNYMGYSTGFNYFTGFAEAICGVLLFFRKTTTLGAVIGLVVAGNIMAINYCFDVPVKILATTLVIMCLFILIRDSKRLINFFFLNKDALPSNLSPHRFKTKWKNIVLISIKYLLVIYIVFGDMISAVQTGAAYGDNSKKPPLYGLYQVETFVKNKDTLPPLTTDTTRWSKFMISFEGRATVKLMNDSMKNYSVKIDTAKHTIIAHTNADTIHKFRLNYVWEKPDIITFKGNWKTDSIFIRMHKFDPKKFLLIKRGFHWVNEFPFNK